MAYDSGGRCIELTDRIGPDGALDWVAAGGDWKLYAVSQRPTGQKVKRAAPGGEGPMLNPFFPEAIQHYLPRFSEAFALSGVAAPRAMYHDSYEYTTGWAPDLFEQFKHRRGYRLQLHVAELFAADGDDRTARVKCDFRETVSDVMTEQFLPPWVQVGPRPGLPHPQPGPRLAGQPVGSLRRGRHPRNRRCSTRTATRWWPSSPRRPRTSAARTSSAPRPAPGWPSTSPRRSSDLKRLVDEMFVSGINHVFYHGTCYSPDDASWPGWLFYAATEMNPRNAIWHDVAWLNAYIARCQSVLQAGRPDNDILLYWPIHDFWHNPKGLVEQLTVHDTRWLADQPIGKAASSLWQQGYAFDYLSDRQLAAARVRGRLHRIARRAVSRDRGAGGRTHAAGHAGQIAGAGRAGSHRGLPGSFAARRARAGRSGTAPRRVAALLASVQPAASRDPNVQLAKVGRGRVLIGPLPASLAQVAVSREPMADLGSLAFVRRARPAGEAATLSGGRGWDYLIVNRGRQPVEDWITLGTPAASAVWMDPMSGQIGLAAIRDDAENTQVYVQLQPGESLILRSFARRRADWAAWPYWRPRGKPIELTGVWSVAFQQGGPACPSRSRPPGWARGPRRAAPRRRLSPARPGYRLVFDAPARGDGPWQLDLGTVCHSAAGESQRPGCWAHGSCRPIVCWSSICSPRETSLRCR